MMDYSQIDSFCFRFVFVLSPLFRLETGFGQAAASKIHLVLFSKRKSPIKNIASNQDECSVRYHNKMTANKKHATA